MLQKKGTGHKSEGALTIQIIWCLYWRHDNVMYDRFLIFLQMLPVIKHIHDHKLVTAEQPAV